MSSKHLKTDSCTSVFVISRAIKTGKYEITKEETSDMRNEYLNIVENKSSSFTEKKQSMYNEIVQPIHASLNLKPKITSFTIFVYDRQTNKCSKYKMNNQVICFGRLSGNDIILSKDNKISRIQGYMFVAGSKIVYLDVWSVSGTTTKQRSNKHKLPLSTVPNRRNVLLYNKNEIIHLQVAKCVDILIIPQRADKQLLKSFKIYKHIKQIEHKLDDNKKTDCDQKSSKKRVAQTVNDFYSIPCKPYIKIKNGKHSKYQKLSKKKQKFKDWICKELELEEYYQIFVSNGFDDIDVTRLLTDKDLKAIGIDKKGSRMKIRLYANKAKYIEENNVYNEGTEGADTEAQILSYIINYNNDSLQLGKMSKKDMLKWIKSIGLSEKWERIMVDAIYNCEYNENDINGLKSGKCVSKLFGLDNPMLASRVWKEMKKIK